MHASDYAYIAQGPRRPEDAAVLSRCLEGVDADDRTPCKRYEANRCLHRDIHSNDGQKHMDAQSTDPTWVYATMHGGPRSIRKPAA